MRITGSLFTFSELSASIADNTFTRKLSTSSILLDTNECVTVLSASAIVNINIITGSSLRYPFYHELIPTASISGSGSVQSLTYSFFNEALDSSYIFTLIYNGIAIVQTDVNVPTTVMSCNIGDTFSTYINLLENPPISCANGYEPVLEISLNSSPYTTISTCPYSVFGEITVAANENWQIVAVGTQP